MPVDLRPYTVAHWKLNDNAASKTVVDSVGDYHGTAQQNTNLLATTGKVNGALTFNGTTDYINANNTFQSTFQSDFSISVWIKPDDGQPPTEGEQTENDILGYLNELFTGGAIELWHYTFDNKGLISFLYSPKFAEGGITLTPSSSLMSDGQQDWHHIIVVVYQNGTKVNAELYFDNVLVKSGTSAAEGNMSNYSSVGYPYIGLNNLTDWTQGHFKGLFDDFRIHNKALSQAERDFLYNGGNGTEELVETVNSGMCCNSDWSWSW